MYQRTIENIQNGGNKMEQRFKPGDKVHYAPQDNDGIPYKFEQGIVKYENPHAPGTYFVLYHYGCTAAATNSRDLIPFKEHKEGFKDNYVHPGCNQCGGNLYGPKVKPGDKLSHYLWAGPKIVHHAYDFEFPYIIVFEDGYTIDIREVHNLKLEVTND